MAFSSNSQTLMPLTQHGSLYTGSYARGFWFVAPMDFTITGLMVPPEAGTGLQYIHVLKCHALLPINFTAPSTNFTSLQYISGAANNTIVPVNISVQQGDTLVIMGKTTSGTSYSTSGIHTSTIGPYTVAVGRAGTQNNITTAPAPNFWGYDPLTSYELGRVFMYYQLASPTDAGLQTFVFPVDSVCEGNNDVIVRLRNNGPSTLQNVDIEWEINATSQTSYSWTGTLAINDSSDVTIGSYPFQYGVNYNIKAYTSMPNLSPDTINNLNDTAHLSGINIKHSPGVNLNDTIINICQNDTAIIGGTFSGTPPWNIIINDGTTNIPVNNITNPLFSFVVTPSATTTYFITSVTDATGCENSDTLSVIVSVQAAPPATISPVTSTAVCYGDSVKLMASIGLNFSYIWYKDGITLPSDTSYILTTGEGGDYSVRVINPTGCSSLSNTVTVTVHPLPVVTLGNDTVLLPGQNILLDAGPGFNSYLWSTNETTQTITVDSSGTGIGVKTIWVHVTNNYYCSGGDTILINFTQNPGIRETLPDAIVRIIPNPSVGKFQLHLAQIPEGIYKIEIVCPDGKTAHRSNHKLNKNNIIDLNLGNLPDGFYLLKISGIKGTFTDRIIIMN